MSQIAQRIPNSSPDKLLMPRNGADAKGECGMADYEACGWNAWHHHMALVLLAQSFLLDDGILMLIAFLFVEDCDVQGFKSSVALHLRASPYFAFAKPTAKRLLS